MTDPRVELRPLRDEEFAAWFRLARDDYADDLARNGADPGAARAKAERDSERLFPGGVTSADQSVWVIEADGEPVGDLWLGVLDGELRRSLFVWNIRIDEEHRGRGYGRQAMLFAEDEARRRGLGHVALNVIGDNEVARRLYRSLGYRELSVSMEKPIGAVPD